MQAKKRVDIALVASLGGHLTQLETAASCIKSDSRVWITSPGAKASALVESGEVVKLIPRLDKSNMTLKSIASIALVALRLRPRWVVSTGAGVAVPFALVARLVGARVIFIETQARVYSGSATGKFLKYIARTVIVQWPELLSVYPKGVVAEASILTSSETKSPSYGGGTFVTVGSHDQPFERIFQAVQAADRENLLPKPIVLQRGVTRLNVPGAVDHDFVSPTEFDEYVRKADLVITHGGSGAIATVLKYGKRPVVFSRRADLHEHVDGHQEDLVKKLADLDLIDIAVDIRSLRRELTLLNTRRNLSHVYPVLTDALKQALSP